MTPMRNSGYYSQFGGAFIPEILVSTFDELETAYLEAQEDPSFWQEYLELMSTYSCRATPITRLDNLTEQLGGANIYVKREDLNHTGAHKANNVMGQGLLTRRMGKKRVIAETGAGQHGVATATMAAKFGFDCTIYMGAHDVARQRPNVFWMEQMGATVVAVTDGSQTLKDAINEAFRDWVTNMDDTHYVLGTACGPHPFPMPVLVVVQMQWVCLVVFLMMKALSLLVSKPVVEDEVLDNMLRGWPMTTQPSVLLKVIKRISYRIEMGKCRIRTVSLRGWTMWVCHPSSVICMNPDASGSRQRLMTVW